MESNIANIGSSIKVPVVQELAKEKLSTVPSRYLRPDHHLIPVNSKRRQIPVIDMQKLISDPNFMDSELHKLHTSCQEWGFFQLINHGVDLAVTPHDEARNPPHSSICQ
ncbi:hypothetical protein MIMGU_mgv1a016759mg [Erythranthe guttata]|uniref:Non-haem dioxygenase N-terminal domain-containing protein n=1 Tax=Erythranthe guttata TaxID=4155 RepID=A0A022QHI0_ERYGU|nr:hypothetical protein MIMGU_mgv1a016759mg [Erythranthe guttata]